MKQLYVILLSLLTIITTASNAAVNPPPAPWASGQNSQATASNQVPSQAQQYQQQRPNMPAQNYSVRPNYNAVPPGYRGQSAYPPGYGGRPPYPPTGYRYQNRPHYPGQGFRGKRNPSPWDRMTRDMPWNNMGGWNNNNGNNQGWGPDFGEGRIFTSSPDKWFRGQDGIADLWDDMLEAPSRFGEMPGGWSAPSISVPNPVDVGDQFGEASKEIPDFVQDIPDMFDFNY